MTEILPPSWAERLLRLQLSPRDRDTLSGDFVELYRARVDANGDLWRADAWYVLEVLRVSWYEHGAWISSFALATLGRTYLDWFVPTNDFVGRSLWSTALGIGILSAAGLSATWRLRSIGSAVVAAAGTALGGGILHAIGAAVLLAARHDAATLAAIRGSGGEWEAFTLPLFIALPAMVIGFVTGTMAWLVRRATDADV